MNNERFFNHYVELLTSTLHEALGKNIVFQAQAKVSAEDFESLQNTITHLNDKIEEYKNIENNVQTKDSAIREKEDEIGRLKSERDSAKNEASHIETFRNELIAARNEIQKRDIEINNIKTGYENKLKDLEETIKYLQMTPAQKRKFDSTKTKVIQTNIVSDNNDGGSF
jgi:chromosome segregation ATPase